MLNNWQNYFRRAQNICTKVGGLEIFCPNRSGKYIWNISPYSQCLTQSYTHLLLHHLFLTHLSRSAGLSARSEIGSISGDFGGIGAKISQVAKIWIKFEAYSTGSCLNQNWGFSIVWFRVFLLIWFLHLNPSIFVSNLFYILFEDWFEVWIWFCFRLCFVFLQRFLDLRFINLKDSIYLCFVIIKMDICVCMYEYTYIYDFMILYVLFIPCRSSLRLHIFGLNDKDSPLKRKGKWGARGCWEVSYLNLILSILFPIRFTLLT